MKRKIVLIAALAIGFGGGYLAAQRHYLSFMGHAAAQCRAELSKEGNWTYPRHGFLSTVRDLSSKAEAAYAKSPSKELLDELEIYRKQYIGTLEGESKYAERSYDEHNSRILERIGTCLDRIALAQSHLGH